MKKVVMMFIPALICGVVFKSCVSDNPELIDENTIDEIILQQEELEWWQPILQKHNLKLGAYNNFENVFVMGMEGNSINNGICTLKMATVLVRYDKSYVIIEANTIYHDIGKDVFEITSGVGNFYEMDCDLPEPTMTIFGISKFTVSTKQFVADYGEIKLKRNNQVTD